MSATNRDLEQAVRDGRLPGGSLLPAGGGAHPPPVAAERGGGDPGAGPHPPGAARPSVWGWRWRASSPQAMEVLLSYPWPGNIRELENVLERALVLSGGAAHRAWRTSPRRCGCPAPEGPAAPLADTGRPLGEAAGAPPGEAPHPAGAGADRGQQDAGGRPPGALAPGAALQDPGVRAGIGSHPAILPPRAGRHRRPWTLDTHSWSWSASCSSWR